MQQTLSVALALCVASSSMPRKCQRPADQLYRYSICPVVTESVLKAATKIALGLPEKCLKDEVFIDSEHKRFSVGSVTRLYSRICQKSTSPAAAVAFAQFRVQNWHSADEEFSLSMERVFVSKPEPMLRFIRAQSDSVRRQLLNDITWGFLTNRVYGPVDPYEEKGRQRFTPGEPMPQEVLNKRNYRQIFYNLHPDMKSLLNTYAYEFDIILTAAGKYLETWGVEY